jgi:hypothetical protein
VEGAAAFGGEEGQHEESGCVGGGEVETGGWIGRSVGCCIG